MAKYDPQSKIREAVKKAEMQIAAEQAFLKFLDYVQEQYGPAMEQKRRRPRRRRKEYTL